jgi:hypothetical protein
VVGSGLSIRSVAGDSKTYPTPATHRHRSSYGSRLHIYAVGFKPSNQILTQHWVVQRTIRSNCNTTPPGNANPSGCMFNDRHQRQTCLNPRGIGHGEAGVRPPIKRTIVVGRSFDQNNRPGVGMRSQNAAKPQLNYDPHAMNIHKVLRR